MDSLKKKVRKLQEKVSAGESGGGARSEGGDRRRTNRYSETRPNQRRPLADSQRTAGPNGPPISSHSYRGGNGPPNYHPSGPRPGGYEGGMGRRPYTQGSRYGGVSADTMINGVGVSF